MVAELNLLSYKQPSQVNDIKYINVQKHKVYIRGSEIRDLNHMQTPS